MKIFQNQIVTTMGRCLQIHEDTIFYLLQDEYIYIYIYVQIDGIHLLYLKRTKRMKINIYIPGSMKQQ